MNDSNNNIFGNNDFTSQSQSNNQSGDNFNLGMNNSNDNLNQQSINNNTFASNTASMTSSQQPDILQMYGESSMRSKSNVNSQINNSVFNSIGQATNNSQSINNNLQSMPQFTQNTNNNVGTGNISSETTPQQNTTNIGTVSIENLLKPEPSSIISDDELLKAFIGNNYEKITTRKFNFAGFFFTTLYMFYRKMFGYTLIVFLINLIVLNVIDKFIVTLLFCIIVGFLVNKLYLSYAKKKVAIIKMSNPQKNQEELNKLCAAKGGTSVGQIFVGLFVEVVIAIVLYIIMAFAGISSAFVNVLNPTNWLTINGSSTSGGKLLEDVSVSGYGCLGSNCNVTIDSPSNNSEEYILGINNTELFNKLGDYKDYIKLNIYYKTKGNTKTIVDYKIYLKSNNEDISSITSESELRDKIGLYSLGTHTDVLTLTEIGEPGFGFKDGNSYTYTDYKFVDSKGVEYEMKYTNGSLNLVVGNNYTITFDVSEGTFGYEFTIQSIN